MPCVAQNFQEDFSKYYAANDTVAQLNTLRQWEKESPNDAELYTSYFNYYFNLAKHEVIAIEEEPNSAESLQFADTLGNVKGYINNKIEYKDQYINKGFEYINKGIEKHPTRLDMRFGKVHVYSKMKYWDDYTKTIINTIDYAEKINYQWKWTDNKVLERPTEFFLGTVQDYTIQLYNQQDDKLIPLMQSLALKVLDYHPNNVKNLSNLSITYLLEGKTNQGLDALLKAEKVAPTDFTVLSNIAYAYRLKGDLKNCILYYEKTMEHGDEQAKQFAAEQIKLIKESEK
jgi:tetratricopeptide (TPR) repeat protein